MYSLSKQSHRKLQECHRDIYVVIMELLKTFNIIVLTGFRNQKEQDEKYFTGKSKVRFPHSKHNKVPSMAVDIAPYPIDWGEHEKPSDNIKALGRFYYMAGKMNEIARNKGITLRWGGDWDGDNDFMDQTFDDLGHFEKVGK